MSNISARATSARESARQNDGKFGSYQLNEVDPEADLDLGFLEEDMDGEGVEMESVAFTELKPGDRIVYADTECEVIGAGQPCLDVFGRTLDSIQARRLDTGQEGPISYGPGGRASRIVPSPSFGDDPQPGPRAIADETGQSLREQVIASMRERNIDEARIQELLERQQLRHASTPTFEPTVIAENLDQAAECQLHVGDGIWTRTCRCGQTFPTLGAQVYDRAWDKHVRDCEQISPERKAAVDEPMLPRPKATEPQRTEEPGEDQEQHRLVRLSRINGKLPRSVKSIETTATRFNDALASPRLAVIAYDDSSTAEVQVFSAQCRCGKPAVRAGACANLLHGALAKPKDREYITIGSYDTGHDLPARLAPALAALTDRSPNKATTEDLQTLSDVATAAGDPREAQKKIDALRKEATQAAAATARAANPPQAKPRRAPGWREHITASAADMNTAAAEHGIRIEARPDNPEEVYVSVPVPATFRGQPQYDRDGTPRMRQTGFLTVRVDPTDRAQMGDLSTHVRSAVADQLDGLRRPDPRYTDQANADNAAASEVFQRWLQD